MHINGLITNNLGENKKALNGSICQFSWCKYFHCGKFQSTNMDSFGSQIPKIPGIFILRSQKLVCTSSSTTLPGGLTKTNISGSHLHRFLFSKSGWNWRICLFKELPAPPKWKMTRAAFPRWVWWSPTLVNGNKCFREIKRLHFSI